jgi:hypothetical protein
MTQEHIDYTNKVIFDRINNASAEQVRALTLATDASGNLTSVGTKDYFTKIGLTGMGADLPAGEVGYSPLIQQQPEVTANAKLANDHLKQYAQESLTLAEASGDSFRITGARAYLAKLGFAGAILDVGLMANDANAAYMAGDTGAAQQIVGDWAISAAAGGAASAAAMAAASALGTTAYLNALGPVGTFANFAIAAVAGVAGGIYGPEVVTDLLNSFNSNSSENFTEGTWHRPVTRFGNGAEYRPSSWSYIDSDGIHIEAIAGNIEGTWTSLS